MANNRSILKTVLLAACMTGSSGAQTAASREAPTAEQVFQQAMQNMNAGAYANAEAGFQQILHKDPRNAAVLINLGVLYAKTSRLTEAVDVYRKALQVVPAQEAVQLNLGLAYLKLQQYSDALPYFERLHQAHAADVRVTTLLATALAYSGKPADAIRLLQPLTASADADRGALYVLGIAYTRADRQAEARETLARVFAGAPPAQEAFLLGEAYLEATDYPNAVQAFQDALSNDADSPGAHRELGRAYLGMHGNDKAEEQLRLALKADPHDSAALYLLGALLVQLSRWADGRTVLEQAQAAAPGSWATAFYLGKANFELHDLPVADKQLRRAAELNPDEPGAPYLLARIARAQGHPEEAARYMERVAALHATALDAEKKAVESANRDKTHLQGGQQ